MNQRFPSLAAIVGLLTSTVLVAQSSAPKKPVYIYLYARVTDHVNIGIAEDQLRRVLPMVERYRAAHPDEHITATVLFSGAVSQALAERNSQTHIRDYVLDYVKRGVIEPGYDGTDEPTYDTRPIVDTTTNVRPEDRWKQRVSEEKTFLTTGRDPLSGVPRAGTVGGLKEMQEVFGRAACITGLGALIRTGPGTYTTMGAPPPKPLPGKVTNPVPALLPEVGGDTEAVLAARSLNTEAIMFGMPDANAAKLPGFGGGRSGFAKLINPNPDTAPELFWQDGVLRTSETSGNEVHLVRAWEGVPALLKVTDKADRSSVRVIHVEIGGEQAYVKPDFAKGPEYPPLSYAYAHPGGPALPSADLSSPAEIDDAYVKQDAVLKLLADQFLPANSGSSFVSSADLKRLVQPDSGYSVSVAALTTAAAEFLKQWGPDTYSPPLFRVQGHYLSRAEVFQVMADALAEFHRSGKLPESVTVAQVHGPIRVLTGHGPNAGEVSVAALAKACSEIAPGLHDDNSDPIDPKNVVPIGITIDGVLLNPQQFVRLMALALQNPEPEAKLNIKMAYEFTSLGELYPRSRPNSDAGFVWTLKPVTIRTDQLQAEAKQ